MDPRQALLASLHADPTDRTAWLALADCLEESGEDARAELLRAQVTINEGVVGRRRKFTKERLRCQHRAQELLAAGVRPCVPTLSFALSRRVRFEAALVPPGTFVMGAKRTETNTFGDERPRHLVTITKPFYLGIYPVTQAQWSALTRSKPSRFRGDDRPVDQVNVEDADRFCQQLGKKIGRKVRLPTEAEWEYACRAGTMTRFASGDSAETLKGAGWYDLEETQPVGQLQPNGWGLYDMHGNVWEWTLDHYARYHAEDQTDPLAIADPSLRVARGGSFSNPPFVCRSACRIGFAGGGRNDFIGCRGLVEWVAP